jgi:hypothetical protein
MDRNVFLAVLAMDVYNRGYGVSVRGLPEAGSLGSATLITAPSQAGWEDASFYAIAYEWNGETIISFRGTDFPNDPLNPTEAEIEAVTAHASARHVTVAH